MNHRRSIVLCMFVSLFFMLNGCKPSSSSQGGFAISVAERTQSASGKLSPPRPIPNVDVWGSFVGTIPNEQAYGTVQGYSGYEGDAVYACQVPAEYDASTNYYWVCNGEAPANWNHLFTLNFHCGDLHLHYSNPGAGEWTYELDNVETFLTSGAEGDCLTTYVAPASTRFAILGQFPQAITLSGEAPFTTTYGMPELYVYDGTATLVATETATSTMTACIGNRS
jgi:hypothetical protein